MPKLVRARVVQEALDLLDEAGLNCVSTRRLAQRLGVEQPALYWHFRNKAELLAAMAEAAMAPHGDFPLPGEGDDWRAWFADNMRSFRRTLLLYRDGARLHAGSRPGKRGAGTIAHKIAFLLGAGVEERDAHMGLYAAGRFTVGSVLEEQADAGATDSGEDASALPEIDHEEAFEAGLALLISGMR
jgi:TetR/AcrR family tetracycline transcriptional repressor